MARPLAKRGGGSGLPSVCTTGYDGTSMMMERGDGGKPVFEDYKDRYRWVDFLEKACGGLGWQVHAWVLLLEERAFSQGLFLPFPSLNLQRGSSLSGSVHEMPLEPSLCSRGRSTYTPSITLSKLWSSKGSVVSDRNKVFFDFF